MSIYEWSDRLHVASQGITVSKHVDANIVGQAIEEIGSENEGEIVAAELVNKSRPKRSPTHDLFEWNDGEAAEKYRLEQAKYVIRSVKVVYEPKKGKPRKISAFSNVKSKRQAMPRRVYVSTTSAMNDTDMRNQILLDALGQLIAWRRKWADLNEIAEEIEAVDSVIKKVQKKAASVG